MLENQARLPTAVRRQFEGIRARRFVHQGLYGPGRGSHRTGQEREYLRKDRQGHSEAEESVEFVLLAELALI